ncbi:hypothetical protein DE146DRAFT_640225 [Phaeosphaeria sp. MPI-PUGE-AT-0046c]|nr:hypothetical protein DE146DRAFT_640225 [Phaeosphaeria sp. MPI-PUGE-AT-0046c]
MKLSYFLILPVVSAGVIITQQTPVLQDVEENTIQSTTYENIAHPVIGVHFSTSYAIAAARYQNGTTQDLSKVAGDLEYIELMARWADQGRSVGMEQDVAVLADFMKKTRNAIETELGMRITRIAPAFPQLPAYGNEAVRKALSLARLASTRDHLVSDELAYTEFTAADAALAHHVRSSAKDRKSRRKAALTQHVLYVNFDNSSFSVAAMSLQSTNEERNVIRSDMNTQLGWWNMPVYDAPRAKFWARIQAMILDVVEPMPRPPSRVVLMGDHGADEEFKGVVTTAVWNKYEFDVELMLSPVRKEDATRLAARGAAELAWRDDIRQREREVARQKEEPIEL